MRFFPASIRRAFFLMGQALRGRFENTPFFFFGIVLGLALVFRAGVGWYRESLTETKVETAPAPELASAAPVVSASAVASASENESARDVGVMGHPEPIGMPARVAPKTRGHGRHGSPIH